MGGMESIMGSRGIFVSMGISICVLLGTRVVSNPFGIKAGGLLFVDPIRSLFLICNSGRARLSSTIEKGSISSMILETVFNNKSDSSRLLERQSADLLLRYVVNIVWRHLWRSGYAKKLFSISGRGKNRNASHILVIIGV